AFDHSATPPPRAIAKSPSHLEAVLPDCQAGSTGPSKPGRAPTKCSVPGRFAGPGTKDVQKRRRSVREEERFDLFADVLFGLFPCDRDLFDDQRPSRVEHT